MPSLLNTKTQVTMRQSVNNAEDDHQSIEDWCATARPTEDYALGRFLDRIERNLPVDEAELEDWSGSLPMFLLSVAVAALSQMSCTSSSSLVLSSIQGLRASLKTTLYRIGMPYSTPW